MKKVLLDWGIFLGVALGYWIWQNRSDVFRTVTMIDEEVLDQARYRRAIEQTLRSIRRLPETKEDS